MTATLNEDQELPNEEQWVVHGRTGFLMDLGEETVMQLLRTGIIKFRQTTSGPGFTAHIYDSIDSGKA